MSFELPEGHVAVEALGKVRSFQRDDTDARILKLLCSESPELLNERAPTPSLNEVCPKRIGKAIGHVLRSGLNQARAKERQHTALCQTSASQS